MTYHWSVRISVTGGRQLVAGFVNDGQQLGALLDLAHSIARGQGVHPADLRVEVENLVT